MKYIIAVLSSLCLTFTLTSCAKNNTDVPIAETTSRAEEAYLVIFQEFYPPDKISVSSGREFYIAVDLSEVLHSDTDVIKEKIDEYLSGSGAELLWDDMNGLIKSGYIETDWRRRPLSFENGVLFSYTDISLTETMLQTEATQWYSNLGGDGAVYTVQKKSDAWEITDITDSYAA